MQLTVEAKERKSIGKVSRTAKEWLEHKREGFWVKAGIGERDSWLPKGQKDEALTCRSTCQAPDMGLDPRFKAGKGWNEVFAAEALASRCGKWLGREAVRTLRQ